MICRPCFPIPIATTIDGLLYFMTLGGILFGVVDIILDVIQTINYFTHDEILLGSLYIAVVIVRMFIDFISDMQLNVSGC